MTGVLVFLSAVALLYLVFSRSPQPRQVRIETLELPEEKPRPDYYYGKNRGTERPVITPALRKRIEQRHGYRCAICCRDLRQMKSEIGHKIPFVAGGTDDEWNLFLLCVRCNRDMRDELLFYVYEIVHLLGQTISDRRRIVTPYHTVEQIYFTRLRELGRLPDFRPWWLVRPDKSPILLRQFEYAGGKGLEAERLFLDDLAQGHPLWQDWRKKAKVIRTKFHRSLIDV